MSISQDEQKTANIFCKKKKLFVIYRTMINDDVKFQTFCDLYDETYMGAP